MNRRLTWDGHSVSGAGQYFGTGSLQEYVRASGAPDLAEALPKAKPGIVGDSPPAKKENDDWGKPWSDPGILNGDPGQVIAAAAMVAGAAAGAVGAGVAVVSVLQGVWSELDPNPTLEDILEAYNQRLAFALGLDSRDVSLVTCMPRPHRPLNLTGRERMRGQYLVRAGIGIGLAVMGVSSAVIIYQGSQSQRVPDWALGCFGAGAGAILANVLLGYSLVW